jgi:alcohol dehydrogenase
VAFNFDAAPERYRLIGNAVGLELSADDPGRTMSAILEELNRLRRASGIDRTLRQIGVHESCIPELARKAMKDPCIVTNPRRPCQKDIEAIYEEAF